MDDMSIFFRGIFEEVEMIDSALASAVNSNMCGELCTCLKDENNSIRRIYFAEDEAIFKKFGRTKEDTI